MKKLLILLLVLSLCLASCRGGQDISAEAVMEKIAPVKSGYTYCGSAATASVEYISAEELGFLYYGERTPLTELEYTESYCLFLSMGFPAEEIHVYKAKHQSDVEALKRMLTCRKELLSSHKINPNDSEFFGKGPLECQVFSVGRFVFLTACEDARALRDRIENLI